ncbi:DUF6877 family protein [Mammaliicoccus sciuri]|uniref:DUF6877 family protein n=1 Tax=Sporosarcina newyorkensis TaxID=759851 RepID=UPI00346BBDEB
MSKNPIAEITKISDQLPIVALQDIHKRIADWLAGGGKHDDPYVWRQLRYVKSVAERVKVNGR